MVFEEKVFEFTEIVGMFRSFQKLSNARVGLFGKIMRNSGRYYMQMSGSRKVFAGL